MPHGVMIEKAGDLEYFSVKPGMGVRQVAVYWLPSKMRI